MKIVGLILFNKNKKARIFKCKVCGREFYVPHDVYKVNCPCGVMGYSEEKKGENV